MSNQRFKLNIRVQVQETDEHGYVRNYQGLTVEHVVDLGPLDFMGLAGVLGQFHNLAEEIKKSQSPKEIKE